MPRINASTTAVELRPQGYYGETYIDNGAADLTPGKVHDIRRASWPTT